MRQKVELLKDYAVMVCSDPVFFGTAPGRKRGIKNIDDPLFRLQDTAQQIQKRRLSAPASAFNKKVLRGVKRKMVNLHRIV